jgi:nitrogen fixation protein NifB
MNMMRHCRQCRADAVGLLGEDRGAEFTMDKIEKMDIDYSAAMEKRAQLHETFRQKLDAKQAEAQHKVKEPTLLAPEGTRPVLMAIASKGGGLINQHFGHAREFMVYEASPAGVRFIGHRKTDLYCSGGDTCGEAESSLDQIIRSLEGCEAVLCSKVGYEPWGALEAAGIQPNGEHGMEPIEEAVAAVYGEMLRAGKLAEPLAHVMAG